MDDPFWLAAFPTSVEAAAQGVARSLGDALHPTSSRLIQDSYTCRWGAVLVDGEELKIPYRHYQEPSASRVDSEAELVRQAWLTRSHLGRVRQRAMRYLLRRPAAWHVPYVLQLAGEYVIEIGQDIAEYASGPLSSDDTMLDAYRRFWRDNPAFVALTHARSASYWAAYYRGSMTLNDYPAYSALSLIASHIKGGVQASVSAAERVRNCRCPGGSDSLALVPKLREAPGRCRAVAAMLLGPNRDGRLMVEWAVFSLVGGCVSTAVLMYLGRRRGHAPARETGKVVEVAPSVRADRNWSLVGAAVMPGSFGKVSATWPLGLMECTDSSVEVRIRPGWLSSMFGVRPMRTSPGEDVEVFPARSFFGQAWVGIRAGERECYFWALGGRAELMGRLQASGYRVTSSERKIVYL